MGEFVIYLVERPLLGMMVAGIPGAIFLGLAIKGYGVSGKGFLIRPHMWLKPGKARGEDRAYLGFFGILFLIVACLLFFTLITE